MKISFDSALLWLIPYLYVVSIAYYWGFWGALDIDAFNYYEVSDLVKGVTAPLGNTLFFVVSFSIMMLLVEKLIETLAKRNFIVFLALVLTLLALLFSVFWLVMRTARNNFPAGENEFWHHTVWVLAGLIVVANSLNRIVPNEFLSSPLRKTILLFLVALPSEAHMEGRRKSLFIRENATFDYVIADSLVTSESVFKFLGKAGSYYFLSTIDNQKRIIIPTDKLAPLVLEHYSRKDTVSVARFTATRKRLATDSLRKD